MTKNGMQVYKKKSTHFFSFWTDEDKGSRKPSLLCSDISYWIDKPCYEDHEFFDEKGLAKYLETRRCSYYQNDFKAFDDKNSCPHLWEYCLESQKWHCSKEECDNNEDYSYCNQSQKCIPRQWMCDGAIQCPIAGEDEAFKFCQTQATFPQGATIQCIESLRPGFNVEIKATPCDGIHECVDGSDEKCRGNFKKVVYIMSGCFLFVIGLIWLGLYLIITKFSERENDLDDLPVADKWKPILCKALKGNALAELKVNI